MCFGGNDNSDELKIAREAAARATARANAALSAAQSAAKQAAKLSAPASDQESAQKAAERQWRKTVAEGTYTKTFGSYGSARAIGGLAPASIGYRMLTGEVAA